MKKLFNEDNVLMRGLSFLWDLICLNLIFVLSCIPIITVGAAISSLFHVTIRMVRKEDMYILPAYFKAFRGCFKQSTLLFLPLCFACAFFGADLYIIHNLIDPSYIILQYPIWFIVFALASITIYAFPLIGLYENKTKQVLKNALLLSLSNIPTTIFIIVLHLLVILFCYRSGENLVIAFSLCLFIGCAAMAYFCSLFLSRILERCEQSS